MPCAMLGDCRFLLQWIVLCSPRGAPVPTLQQVPGARRHVVLVGWPAPRKLVCSGDSTPRSSGPLYARQARHTHQASPLHHHNARRKLCVSITGTTHALLGCSAAPCKTEKTHRKRPRNRVRFLDPVLGSPFSINVGPPHEPKGVTPKRGPKNSPEIGVTFVGFLLACGALRSSRPVASTCAFNLVARALHL